MLKKYYAFMLFFVVVFTTACATTNTAKLNNNANKQQNTANTKTAKSVDVYGSNFDSTKYRDRVLTKNERSYFEKMKSDFNQMLKENKNDPVSQAKYTQYIDEINELLNKK